MTIVRTGVDLRAGRSPRAGRRYFVRHAGVGAAARTRVDAQGRSIRTEAA
ncbi:hypothetical protein [Nocardia sp. NPDC057455]